MVTPAFYWEDNGTQPPVGEAKYTAGTQVYAEDVNWAFKSVETDFAVLFAFLNSYNANTILKADTDNTPIALTVVEERILGRKLGGSIDALNEVDVLQILSTVFLKDGSRAATGDIDCAGHNIDHPTFLFPHVANGFTILDSGFGSIMYFPDSGDIGVHRNIDMGTSTIDGRDVSADGTKLDGIEDSADVTDAANVGAAGAVMYTGATADIVCSDGVKILHQAGPPFTIHGDIRNIGAASYNVLYNITLLDGWKINVLAASIDKRGTNSNLILYDTTHTTQIYDSGSITYKDSGNYPSGFPVSSTAAGITHYEVRLHNATAGAIDAGGFMVLQVETT